MLEKIKSIFQEAAKQISINLFMKYLIERLSGIEILQLKKAIDELDTDIISKMTEEEKDIILNAATTLKKKFPDLYNYIMENFTIENVLKYLEKSEKTRHIAAVIRAHPLGEEWLREVIDNIKSFIEHGEVYVYEVEVKKDETPPEDVLLYVISNAPVEPEKVESALRTVAEFDSGDRKGDKAVKVSDKKSEDGGNNRRD